MSRFTKAQQKAIEYETNNILINAGAGSGKTTVLTQRIINKLKKGTKINELLVLTFTNAAAAEMKERIINEVKKYEELKEILPYVYISDVMTFDGYLLKLLKKYGYIIDVSQNIKIGDDILLDKILSEVIDEVFNNYYKILDKNITGMDDYKILKESVYLNKLDKFQKDENTKDDLKSYNDWIMFFKLVDNYSIFSDKDLKENIKSLYLQYINVLDKNSLYENITYELQKKKFSEYENLLLSYIKQINILLEELNKYNLDEDLDEVINNYKDNLRPLLSVGSYDVLIEVLEEFKLKTITQKKAEKFDGLKEVHTKVKVVYENLKKSVLLKSTKKELLRDEEGKEQLKQFILNLLAKIDSIYLERKKINNIFNFADIMQLVLQILNTNEEIKNEIKNTYKEILVDEYQDTNDFQNEFINLIQNDNLYLVGDVKQSIYRFRNANPKNFQQLQNVYEEDETKGSVINLLHNFRSREEVLTSVNNIFEQIMTQDFGMIDYKNNQALQYGNKSYDTKDNINYNMECIEYDKEGYEAFDKEYIEPYIIAQDIRSKIDNGYKVLKGGKLENCTYSDFTILTRSKKDYDTFKKVFDFFNLPLIIQKEETLNDKENYEIITLLNILKLIVNINDKPAYVGVLRSFLYETLEQDIYDYFKKNKSICEVEDLNNKVEKIKKENIKNLELLIAYIYNEFNFFKYAVKLENLLTFNSKMIKVNEVAQELTNSQKNIYDLIEYLEYCFGDTKLNIELNYEKDLKNSINIMTIHKSKGLEFPVVYIAKMNSKLMKPSTSLISLKNNNLILPRVENYIKYKSFLNYIEDSENKVEEINESIRLLYVAMTRAKEKIIFVDSKDSSKANLNNFHSFSKVRDLIYELKHHMEITNVINEEEDNKIYESMKKSFIANNLLLKKETKVIENQEKNLQNIKSKNNNHKVVYKEVESKLEFISLGVSSKEIENVLTKKEKENIDLGIKIHKYLETFDFLQINNNQYIEEFLKSVNSKYIYNLEYIITNMRQYKIVNKIINFYTEYEFYYEKDNKQISGIIDLLIETKDAVYVIDYKLKDISKDEYLSQVNTYKEVISEYYNKQIYGYLYSLLENKIKEVK